LAPFKTNKRQKRFPHPTKERRGVEFYGHLQNLEEEISFGVKRNMYVVGTPTTLFSRCG